MNRCRSSILAGILELMPSPQLLAGRRSIVGNVYTITMVCRNRHRVFDCPANADLAMQLLGSMDREGLTASLAWIIMPDHLHWLAQLRGQSLGYCVQRFKARSSFLINRRRGSRGAIWQAGYYDHAIRSDASLHRHACYILANPVRAGLAAQIGDHPYGWCRWPLSEVEPAGEREW
nr:transposase [Stenotrophomonas geniculata]